VQCSRRFKQKTKNEKRIKTKHSGAEKEAEAVGR
jgi:hypothetical protein